jgi:hypothetical protein
VVLLKPLFPYHVILLEGWKLRKRGIFCKAIENRLQVNWLITTTGGFIPLLLLPIFFYNYSDSPPFLTPHHRYGVLACKFSIKIKYKIDILPALKCEDSERGGLSYQGMNPQ